MESPVSPPAASHTARSKSPALFYTNLDKGTFLPVFRSRLRNFALVSSMFPPQLIRTER